MFRSAHAVCASGITHERCANLRHRKKIKRKKNRNGANLKLRLAYGRRSNKAIWLLWRSTKTLLNISCQRTKTQYGIYPMSFRNDIQNRNQVSVYVALKRFCEEKGLRQRGLLSDKQLTCGMLTISNQSNSVCL